eukprot:CAMPEP_0205926822 /NCGR_PEP_ID=MMETSP1325-20131115/21284_1 /ASSEMBLY_ACC=CAM_ASM_000708 /TAXON_ID=236786 /ORGANISM="Florenciella sp., Strain RCC1007" /LENGTH=69 /DNA_ID=CAMNT_0053295595 /DNA_START=56 /DNA_END=262 /DNA_ORIENTATION=+
MGENVLATSIGLAHFVRLCDDDIRDLRHAVTAAFAPGFGGVLAEMVEVVVAVPRGVEMVLFPIRLRCCR